MIEVEGLTKVYGAQVALRSVSFVVQPGTVLAVLGPNGSGKSTLLRILAGLLRPSDGRVIVLGCELPNQTYRLRALVGLVGHGTQLYDDLTAFENLAFAGALMLAPPDRPELVAALARVGLEAHADTRVRDLSSGMRRRLALARVTLRRPRVLLLDEPFAGLDQDSLKRLEEDLHAFKAAGGAAIVVTHSLGRALSVGDHVAILAGGRLAAHEPRAGLTEATLQRLYLITTEAAV